jgi:type I restriction enzyme M protein
MSTAQQQAVLDLVRSRQEGPQLKIFDTTDFGYREIKVLRPLKLRFEVNAESLARLDTQSGFVNLAVSKKKNPAEKKQDEDEGRALQAAIRAALQTLAGKTYMQRDQFTTVLEGALKKAGIKLKAPILKAILAGIGERDDNAGICRDSDGNPEPDSDLNDTENVPLKEAVETYFAREVTPHVPDAWIDPTYCDAKDGKVGRVGYEIPFNRHFYVFKPPQPLSVIDAELKSCTDRILTLIGGLSK